MNNLTKLKNIFSNEGIINFTKRKLNIPITKFTINYRGKKTKIILNRAFGYVDMVILKDGIYEKDIVDDIFAELNPHKTLLDIGSNIGQHSLLLAPYCKEIFAFEPIKEVYDQFKESIKLNKYSNIKTFNLGISDKKDTKKFNFVKNHAGASSFIDRSENKANEITVKTDTLQNIVGDVRFDVMKIDVEGYEAVVILGNKEIILKNRPVIFVEYDQKWITKEGSYLPEDLYNFFIYNNFEIFSRTLNKYVNRSEFESIRQDNWIVKPNF